jgi:hypothetical protein
MLFIPGNNPGMLQNGGVFGADAAISSSGFTGKRYSRLKSYGREDRWGATKTKNKRPYCRSSRISGWQCH